MPGLTRFTYFAPRTLAEALDLLAEDVPGTCLLAGGTDLMVQLRRGKLRPRRVIALKGVGGLDAIAFDPEEGLSIGATALLASVAAHADVRRHYPAVSHAALQTANVQVRNMGTVVGNLCNASPCADNAPMLLAHGARAVVESFRGRRELGLEQFFRGPGETALQPDELVTALRVPPPPPGCGASYQNLELRSRVDMTAVAAGALVVVQDGRCADVRLVLGSVAPVPLRAVAAEDLMRGEIPSPALWAAAAASAAAGARPISDQRASADYRRRMVEVLSRRALEAAWGAAREASA